MIPNLSPGDPYWDDLDQTALNLMRLNMNKSIRTIYRIEKPEGRHGMWYDSEGKFDPVIQELCPNGAAKDFPMPKNLELHRKDDRVWNSGGKSIADMRYWFSAQDAIGLLGHGFKLFEFEVTMFQELDKEILFCRDGIITQKEIPLDEIWEI